MKSTPFTELEKALIRKIGAARFPPATASKRFARELASGGVTQLTGEGRRFLAFIANRFRRQYYLSPEEKDWIAEWIDWKEETTVPHHFTKNIVEASAFCNTCNKMTMHAVWDGRLDRCKNDHPHAETKPVVQDTQGRLFETGSPDQLTIDGVYGTVEIK